MSFLIGPSRGPSAIRRAGKPARDGDSQTAAGLPVVIEPAPAMPSGSARGGDAALHAQVIGERRGLRAGAQVHDEARGAYSRVEWSGARDRRRPKGGTARTEV
jgi:hypothetical protein